MCTKLCNGFQQYFSYIMATSFSAGGSRSTRREPPTMGKQLANFITCGWKTRTVAAAKGYFAFLKLIYSSLAVKMRPLLTLITEQMV
jgi:hypothetical protein